MEYLDLVQQLLRVHDATIDSENMPFVEDQQFRLLATVIVLLQMAFFESTVPNQAFKERLREASKFLYYQGGTSEAFQHASKKFRTLAEDIDKMYQLEAGARPPTQGQDHQVR